MELLLNILWLMLALPATWLWLRDPAHSDNSGGLIRVRPLLLLVCVLALLFPVVSATDDLHAMRSEMEEPGPCKRMLRQGAGDKTSSWLSGCSTPTAHLLVVSSPCPGCQFCGRVWALHELLPLRVQRNPSGCRAPPAYQVA